MAEQYTGEVVADKAPTPYAGPVVPDQSPLAKAPPQAAQQPPAQSQPRPAPTLMQQFNRPADRTAELMAQDTQTLFNDIQGLVHSPSIGGGFKAMLHTLGLVFSPVNSLTQAFVSEPVQSLAHMAGAPSWINPYVDVAAQLAMPIAAAKSKTVGDALEPVAKFLFAAPDHGDAVGQVMTAGQTANSVAQKLILHDQASIARDVQWQRSYKQFLEQNPDYHKYDTEIYNAIESGKPLSEAAQKYKELQIDPIRKRNAKLFEQLKSAGVKVGEDVNPDNYIHRQVVEKAEEKNWVQRAADVVDPSGALSNVAQTKGFSPSARMLKDRNAGVVESSVTGEKGGYVLDPTTNHALIYKNGNVVDQGVIQDGNIVTKNGGVWNMSRGTTAEVEQHTPIRYQKSALASSIEANRALNDAVANVNFIRGLKSSPEFLQYARPKGAAAPKDWKTVDIPGYHGFDGWSMHPRVAEVLEDYTRANAKDTNVLLNGINRLMQGSIFINPMGHIFNVQFHAAVEAGLFGGMQRMIDGGVRLITPGERTLTARAIEAVVTQNADYLRYVKESSGLRGANTMVRNFSNNLLGALGKDPKQVQALTPVAKALGYANPFAFIRAVYSASNKTLWGVSDMIMMKSFLAREAEGSTAREAVQEVERHVPNYQIPPRVLHSRGISQLLQGPYSLGFSRYEYNRLASYGHLIRDAINPFEASRARSLDQIAALVFHTAVTYPMLNYAVQQATGNPDAEFRPFGPFVYPITVEKYFEGQRTAGQVVQTIARPSALVETGAEVFSNRDWRGKPIFGHGGNFPAYVASKIYPLEQLRRIVSPPKGADSATAAKQVLEDQLGIKDPTPEQVAIMQKYARIELKKREKDKP